MSDPATPYDYDALWSDTYGDMQDVGPTHRHLRRLLGEVLAEIPYRSALEVGCGAGHNFSLLCEGKRLDRLTGLDLSSEALARARREWPEAELHQLDVQRGSLDGSWDLVLCSLVLEHLPDDLAALRRMREMTQGHLVVTTFAGNFERYRKWEQQMGHVRNYRSGELEDKLERAGFDVEAALYWGFPFYSPIARRLQNAMTSKADYDSPTTLAARLMYYLYWLNSRRRGDVLVVRARAA